MKEEGGVKIDYFRPSSAKCDGNSEKCQDMNEWGGKVQDKSLELIYSNK